MGYEPMHTFGYGSGVGTVEKYECIERACHTCRHEDEPIENSTCQHCLTHGDFERWCPK